MANTQRNSNKLKSKKYYIARAIVLAIFPIALLLMPTNMFDTGADICLITRLSGYHCPGCGMTRACMHMIHFDFAGAWQYNKLSFVVLPILCGLLLDDFIKTIKNAKKAGEREVTREV
jgi:hypothetical protein